MKIAYTYNHLNAKEYLIVNKPKQLEELEECIKSVEANSYLKISCDKQHIGQVYYNQSSINNKIKELLNANGWFEKKIAYYVTGDEETTRIIVHMDNQEAQKAEIEKRSLTAYDTSNQVDFVKDKIAVEVQFGKYFSVAYDLHVKHTFFYLRNDIDVGIEIIPTHDMMLQMDTGVAWYENEVTNVIREGRNNPTVPICIWGIEPETLVSIEPKDYTQAQLKEIIKNSDISKLTYAMRKIKQEELSKKERAINTLKSKIENIQKELSEIEKSLALAPKSEQPKIRSLIKQKDKKIADKEKAEDKLAQVEADISAKLSRILTIEACIEE